MVSNILLLSSSKIFPPVNPNRYCELVLSSTATKLSLVQVWTSIALNSTDSLLTNSSSILPIGPPEVNTAKDDPPRRDIALETLIPPPPAS